MYSFYRNTALKLTLTTVILISADICLAETPALKGMLKFNGKLLWDVSHVEPRFWFRNEDTGKVAAGVAEYNRGKYEVFGLTPGNYGVSVTVNLNSENPPTYPGDLRTFQRFAVASNKTTRLNLDLAKTIRLIKPEDNDQPIPNWGAKCTSKTSFKGPVIFFKWKPIAEGASYNYQVTKPRCKPFTFGDVVKSGTTKETQIVIPLDINGENDIYRFTLKAHKNGRTIGSLMTHGASGHGWDYRFRVR